VVHALEHYDRVMAWLILLIAALFEVGWAIGLKYTLPATSGQRRAGSWKLRA
jgi:multidrug transporter EmrE-like cation transporter